MILKKIETVLNKMSVSKWNYWFSFIFDALLVTTLITVGYVKGGSFALGLLALAIGMIFFTLIEYFVHAKLFHGWVKSFTAAHAKHHRNPMGYDAMPFFFAMIIISPFYLGSYFIVPFAYASLFTAGIFIGYIAYGLMHHYMHRGNFKNSYFRYMVKFHDIHHQQPKLNHGVTVPVWDMVFGTFLPLKKAK